MRPQYDIVLSRKQSFAGHVDGVECCPKITLEARRYLERTFCFRKQKTSASARECADVAGIDRLGRPHTVVWERGAFRRPGSFPGRPRTSQGLGGVYPFGAS